MQTSMFAELPALDPSASQWFTPAWIAERMATWVPDGASVLEPSAGNGALLRPLLTRGHPRTRLTACELDPRWINELRKLDIPVMMGDYLSQRWKSWHFDVCLMNPPYEDGLHADFVAHALTHCREVIALVPSSIEFTATRDEQLWRNAVVTKRARLPNRVKFGGDNSASFDSVVLRIVRRTVPRGFEGLPDLVEEEVWLP